MAKTYKILVNDGKGTDIKPVSVLQGTGEKGQPVRMVAKRGWRFELQDELKGRDLAPDQVRIKRMGKDLGLMFDGSKNSDVVIEDFYADNTDTDKDNGMPTLVGLAENGGMYEYIPQDPAASSMPSALKDGNTPVIVSLGGGPLTGDFVLAGLPLVAAAGGGLGGWLAGGALVAAAAAGGGKGGGGSSVATAPAKATGSLTHDVTNDTGTSQTDSLTNNKTPVLTINAEHGATVVVTVNGNKYTAKETSTSGVYTVAVADALKDGTYTPSITVTNAAGSTTSEGTAFIVDTSTFTEPYTVDPFKTPTANTTGLTVTIDTDSNNDGIISNTELPSNKQLTATIALTKDAAVGDVLTVVATGNTTRTITLTQSDIDKHQYVITDLAAPADGSSITVSASIKDAAGNASPTPDASDVAKVNSAAPGVTITTDTNNDGYINAAELGTATTVSVKVDVPANAIVGDTIKVTDGKSTINHVLTASEVTAKNFTLANAFAIPAEGGVIQVTAAFGNETKADKAILDTSKFIAPIDPTNPTDPSVSGLRVTINTDLNNDGIISNAELPASKLITATVALTKDTAVGDVLTVAATGNTTRTITLTQSDIDKHQYVITDLAAPTDGNSITVSANIKDVAGNASPTPDAKDVAKVDSAALSLRITTDANNDGFINAVELGSAKKVSVEVDVPANAKAGDIITVNDGKSPIDYKLTASDISAKSFTLTDAFDIPAEGASITVTATYAGASANDTAKLDTQLPTPVAVLLDAVTGDDYLTNSEQVGNVTLSGKATGEFRIGDLVVLTINNKTYSTNVQDALGNFTVANVLASDLVKDADTKIEISLTASDAAGNTAIVKNTHSYSLESGNQGLKTAIALDPIANDNILDGVESAAPTTTISGKVTGYFVAGDVVTLSVNNRNYSVMVDAQGVFSKVIDTVEVVNDVDHRIEARVSGTGGDTATANQSYVLDDGSHKTALSIDRVTLDNMVNALESQKEQTLTGKVAGKFATGDVVTLQINDKLYRGNVDSTGVFSIKVQGADLAADLDSTVVGTVTGSGGTTATAFQNYGVDTAVPSNKDVNLSVSITTDANKDELISSAELQSATNFASQAKFDRLKVHVGDMIVFSATNDGVALNNQVVTLSATDVSNGFVNAAFAKPADGKQQIVTVNYVDAVGNVPSDSAPSAKATLDVTPPNGGSAPVVSIATDGANGGVDDGWLNNTEIDPNKPSFKVGAKVTVQATFDKAKVNVGDVVVFTIGNTTQEVVLDVQAKTDGMVSIQVDAPAKGISIVASAHMKDSVGNTTAESASDTATRNSLDAEKDTNAVTAVTGTAVSVEGNVIVNDSDLEYLPDPTKPDSTKIFITNPGTLPGTYGNLELDKNGHYKYHLNDDAAVQALTSKDTKDDVFTYEIKDLAGNVSTSTVTVHVTGMNDSATHFLKDEQSLFLNDSATSLSAKQDALTITDLDANQATLATLKVNGFFGTLVLTQTSQTATQTGYSYVYSENAGLTSSNDVMRHDLLTVQSFDGTDTVTFDFQLKPTGTTIASNEFHTKSTSSALKIATANTANDTLELDFSNGTFDFTGLTAPTNIQGIEKVNLLNGAGNTIKLSLESLNQADTQSIQDPSTTTPKMIDVHRLFIDGNDSDLVQLTSAFGTSLNHSAPKVDIVPGYDSYFVDSNHELLIQHGIKVSFLS